MDTGYIPLPHVSIQWLCSMSSQSGGGSAPTAINSSGRSVLDLSSPSNPRYVFIMPNGVGDQME